MFCATSLTSEEGLSLLFLPTGLSLKQNQSIRLMCVLDDVLDDVDIAFAQNPKKKTEKERKEKHMG